MGYQLLLLCWTQGVEGWIKLHIPQFLKTCESITRQNKKKKPLRNGPSAQQRWEAQDNSASISWTRRLSQLHSMPGHFVVVPRSLLFVLQLTRSALLGDMQQPGDLRSPFLPPCPPSSPLDYTHPGLVKRGLRSSHTLVSLETLNDLKEIPRASIPKGC